jgi:hypothetical protein
VRRGLLFARPAGQRLEGEKSDRGRVAENHFVDGDRIKSGISLEEDSDDERGQIVGSDACERSSEFPEGRPYVVYRKTSATVIPPVLTMGQERVHALALLIRLEQHRLGHIVKDRVRVARRVDRQLCDPQGPAGTPMNPVHQAVGGVEERVRRDDLGEEMHCERLISVKRATGQEHLLCQRFADQFRKTPGRACSGKNPELRLRIREFRGSADAEVAGIGQLGARPDGRSTAAMVGMGSLAIRSNTPLLIPARASAYPRFLN